MRRVRGTGAGQAPPAESAALSGPPKAVGPGGAGRAKGEVVPAPPGGHLGQVHPAEEIFERTDPALAQGEGVRVGFIGNTGCGKTFGMAWAVRHIVDEGFVNVVLVVDDKNHDPPWTGARRVNPTTAAANPPADDEEPNQVVYRGVAMDPAGSVSVDDVARQAWEIAAMKDHPKVALVVDELRRAVSPAGREWRAPTVARAITEGRAAGVSVLWGTQSPQRIPVEAFDNSLLCIFALGMRGRAYLEDTKMISDGVSIVVAGLAPRQFIVVDDAGDWNGRIYEVPLYRRPPKPRPVTVLGVQAEPTTDGE